MSALAALRERGRLPAAVLAVVVHLMFFAFLVFGVNWKTRQPEAMVVDLWSAPPAPPAAEVKPAPPKPAKPEAKPQPRPEIRKADIELKERLKKEEQKAAEALRQQQLKEAQEAQRLAENQERLARETQASRFAEQSRLVEEYKRRIQEKIKRLIVKPPKLDGDPTVEFTVVLLPGGDVLSVKLKKSSTLAIWDVAVERAILKAQPLPLPTDPALFKEFREINLVYHYAESQ